MPFENGSVHKTLSHPAPQRPSHEEDKYGPGVPRSEWSYAVDSATGSSRRMRTRASVSGCCGICSIVPPTIPRSSAPNGNREEGMGRPDPPRTAPVGAMGDPGQLRIRSIPAEVCGDELAADRPFGLGSHEEDPASRESGAAVPGPILAVR